MDLILEVVLFNEIGIPINIDLDMGDNNTKQDFKNIFGFLFDSFFILLTVFNFILFYLESKKVLATLGGCDEGINLCLKQFVDNIL